MNSTRASLLIRIKDPKATDAWSEFYDLYAPLIFRYALRRGLSREDADDIRSECYKAIVQQIGTFDYRKTKGGFKAWLRTIVDRRVIDHYRKKHMQNANSQELGKLETPLPSPQEIWELEWKSQHLKHCVQKVRNEVSQTTFEAFSIVVVQNRSVAEACDELGMNPNQIYKAKARVIRRVRNKMVEIGYEEVPAI